MNSCTSTEIEEAKAAEFKACEAINKCRSCLKEINDNRYFINLGFNSMDEYCKEQFGRSYKNIMGL